MPEPYVPLNFATMANPTQSVWCGGFAGAAVLRQQASRARQMQVSELLATTKAKPAFQPDAFL